MSHGSAAHSAQSPVAAYLEAEQRTGRVDEHVDAAAAAGLLIGACHEAVFHHHLVAGRTEEPDFSALQAQVRALLRGLLPRP